MRTRVITLAVAAAMTLGGCSVFGGDDSSSTSSSSGVVNGDANANGAKAAGIDMANPPKPMAEATIKDVSDDIDSTKIELLELRRDDNVMLATFRLTGTGRGNASASALDLLDFGTFAPVFIDMKNLEKYGTVSELTSTLTSAKAPLGEPVFLFTAFPLPRDGVTSMDLRMTSASASIEDVPMPQ